MRKAISNLRVDKLKRRGLLTGYYHKYQTLKTVRLGWFHCRNIRVHVDLRQTVSIVPRIMFYKKRYHIHLLVRTFRASEPAQFRSPFYDPKSPSSDRLCRRASEKSSSCGKYCFMVRMVLSLQPTYLDCARREGTALPVQGGQPISQRGNFPRYIRAIFSQHQHESLTNEQL
jgi:hypothetical protein